MPTKERAKCLPIFLPLAFFVGNPIELQKTTFDPQQFDNNVFEKEVLILDIGTMRDDCTRQTRNDRRVYMWRHLRRIIDIDGGRFRHLGIREKTLILKKIIFMGKQGGCS